jgi:hypothetical protein
MKKPLLREVAFSRFFYSFKESNKTSDKLAIPDALHKHYPVANVVGVPFSSWWQERICLHVTSPVACGNQLFNAALGQELYYG